MPLNFNVNEQTSWIGYSIDNQANVTVAGNTTISGLADGTHSLVVYANDTAGNMAKSKQVNFTIRNSPPTSPTPSSSPLASHTIPTTTSGLSMDQSRPSNAVVQSLFLVALLAATILSTIILGAVLHKRKKYR